MSIIFIQSSRNRSRRPVWLAGILGAVTMVIKMEVTCLDDALCGYLSIRFIYSLLIAAKNVNTAVNNCPLEPQEEEEDERRLLEAVV